MPKSNDRQLNRSSNSRIMARRTLSPIINIARLLSSEPWSLTFTKSTRSRGADGIIQ